jgi:hypothetical protein
MTDLVKLTLRIPPRLHERLKKRAQSQDCSLNQVILKTLEEGLEVERPAVESPRERALRILRQHNMIAEPGAGRKLYETNEPEITNAQLREMLKGVPPLSDAIIEEREPR